MVFSEFPDMSDSSHDFIQQYQKEKDMQVNCYPLSPSHPLSLPPSLSPHLSRGCIFRTVVVDTIATEMGIAMVQVWRQVGKVMACQDTRIQDDLD